MRKKKSVVYLAYLMLLPMLVFAGELGSIEAKLLKQSRIVSEFSEVQINGNFNVVFVPASEKSHGLEIMAPDFLFDKIKSETNSKVLRVSLDNADFVSTKSNITLYIKTPYLSRLDLRGSNRVETRGTKLRGPSLLLAGSGSLSGVLNIDTDYLELELGGDVKLQLTGRAAQQDFEINGSGSVNARELHGKTGDITVQGYSECIVNVTDALDVEVRGVAKIKYVGSPILDKSIWGYGVVSQV